MVNIPMIARSTLALCVVSVLALTGCASGPAIESGKPDTLTAHVHNDSTGAMLMRGASLYSYASPRCDAEVRLAYKLSMNNVESLATAPVVPGKPFTFALTTLNAQSFKGNWGCTATSTFTPKVGGIYQATLKTANDNGTCEIVILDQDNTVVGATASEYSCNRTFAGIVKGGRGYRVSQ